MNRWPRLFIVLALLLAVAILAADDQWLARTVIGLACCAAAWYFTPRWHTLARSLVVALLSLCFAFSGSSFDGKGVSRVLMALGVLAWVHAGDDPGGTTAPPGT